MNEATSYPATERGFEGSCKWKGFMGRRVGKGAIDKGKETAIFRPGCLLLGERELPGFLPCRLPLLSVGDREGPT